VFVREERET